jgi:hypothetical protein
MNFRLRKDYTTHMPMLIKVVQMTSGPVLELGAGVFSTPLLHWLCAESGRRLDTYEDVADCYHFAHKFRSRNHRIHFVEDWDAVEFAGHWDVVFIDHTTGRRSVDALRLKDKADYIILHDSEAEKHYGYDKVWPEFRYIYHWKNCQPWTTVVSNLKDVSRWN